MKKKRYLLLTMLLLSIFASGCEKDGKTLLQEQLSKVEHVESLAEVPEYSGEPYVVLEDNVPEFKEEELTTESFEEYSELDDLGRCGTAYANISEELMPTQERGPIGQVKPSGWQTVKYNDLIEGNYLYNRCHLIGFQLAGENANKQNLITGTRYLNVTGMLPFENEVADYVKETGNHVLYRVTPVFEGENLVPDGVQMEAKSVEDNGDGVQFHVFCYNVQPQITINYATGESQVAKDAPRNKEETKEDKNEQGKQAYILNKNTHKFHKKDCSSVRDMKPQNKKEYHGTKEDLIKQGYEPCGSCKP